MAEKKPEKVKGVPVTGEEEYFIEFMREQEVKGPERLEEVSRWLVSIISVMTGLFGAGISMLGLTPSAGMKGLSLLPFVFFSAAVIGAVAVNFPFQYGYRKNVPASIREVIGRIVRVKWWCLCGACVFFCAGVIAFVLLFV